MKTTWTLKENATGELRVEVEGEIWEKAQKKVFSSLKKQVNMKGFRKGHVPESLIRAQFPKEAIYEYACEEVANEVLAQAVEENNIELVDRPVLSSENACDESVTLVFACTVKPEVTLGEYKGLDIHKEEAVVTDEDVEEEVKRVQDRYADWVVVEDGVEAKLGDRVNLDYAGSVDGVPFDGGSAEGYDLELGSGTFIPGFEDQLVGTKAGDEKDVVVTFPENYTAELAGKEAVFKCKINEIKEKELPEVNDELIQKLKMEGVETVEQFKENKRESLLKQRESQAERAFEDKLIQAAVSNASVEIPEVMINTEVNNMVKNMENQMQQSGFTLAQYLQAVGQSEEDYRSQMVPQATESVKNSLVLEAIAKAENIEISDERVEEEYAKMHETYKLDIEMIKKYVSPESVRNDLKLQEAVELLKKSVK